MSVDLSKFLSGDFSLRNFRPFPRKVTVGSVEVVYKEGTPEEYVYHSSINLDMQETIHGAFQYALEELNFNNSRENV